MEKVKFNLIEEKFKNATSYLNNSVVNKYFSTLKVHFIQNFPLAVFCNNMRAELP